MYRNFASDAFVAFWLHFVSRDRNNVYESYSFLSINTSSDWTDLAACVAVYGHHVTAHSLAVGSSL